MTLPDFRCPGLDWPCALGGVLCGLCAVLVSIDEAGLDRAQWALSGGRVYAHPAQRAHEPLLYARYGLPELCHRGPRAVCGVADACPPSPLISGHECRHESGHSHQLPFYQFTQPSVAVSPFSGNFVDFFDSFSVRFLRGQGPQNATHGDRDSSPGDPPNARAGDPTDPSPAARRPPRWLSIATRLTRPN